MNLVANKSTNTVMLNIDSGIGCPFRDLTQNHTSLNGENVCCGDENSNR